MDRSSLAALAIAAALAAPGCAWHRAGEADAVAPTPRDVPGPAAGMSLVDVLAVAAATERGDFCVDSRVIRVAEVREGLWQDVSEKQALGPAFAPAPGSDLVVVALRRCRDWQGRERWSDERASWFLLRRARLVAYDHWTFGPRCAVADAFRPLPDGAPGRETERDLLRWLEQRHPPGRLPIEIRFERGQALVGAGRLAEARALLKYGDDGIRSREDLFEARSVDEKTHADFEREIRRLRDMRADLSDAIRRAEAGRAGRSGS